MDVKRKRMDERGEKRGERGYRWKEGEGQGGGAS